MPDEQTQLVFMLLHVLSQQKPETPLMEQPPLHMEMARVRERMPRRTRRVDEEIMFLRGT